MKTLVKKTLTAVVALTLGTQAFAAQGITSVSFKMPSIVVLHYVSDVIFEIDPALFGYTSDDYSISDDITKTLSTFSGSILTGNAAVDVGTDPVLGTYSGVISNAWAVRSMTANGVEVKINIISADALFGTTKSKVTISTPTLHSTGANNNGTSIIDFSSQGMGNPVRGDVGFGIDFSATTAAGTHEGIQYIIETRTL